MVILTEDLKKACEKIALALDTKANGLLADAIGLTTDDDHLYLSVSNRDEYSVKTSINIFEKANLNVTVAAATFLKLIAQTTSNSVELTATDRFLKIKGNGTYKVPLVFDQLGKLFVIPEVKLDNTTDSTACKTEDLLNIVKYNSKIVKGISPEFFEVNVMYYIDEKGCLTFFKGACINSFDLEKPIKFVLNDRAVKLLKLFDSAETTITLGTHDIGAPAEQFAINIKDNATSLTITYSDITKKDQKPFVQMFPANKIRQRAFNNYAHTVEINKTDLSKAMNRMMIFNYNVVYHFEFTSNAVNIYDKSKNNTETVNYISECSSLVDAPYEADLEMSEIKAVVDAVTTENVKIAFGDHQAFTVHNNNIVNVIGEN